MTTAICSIALWTLVQTTCAQYDLPPEPVYALILAESNGDPLAVGDNGRAIGLAQFHEDTFNWMARLYELPYQWPDDAQDPDKALRLLCAALDDGRAAHWRGWKHISANLVPPRDHRMWRMATDAELAARGVR